MHVSVNGVRLFFDVEGPKLVPDGDRMREKPTLLLLHGGPGFDHSTYKPAFARLADVAQLVYLDHRGNGRSERGDPASWNLAQWGDDVRAFCDALGIERPIVFGNSFGGMVAMSYATRHPEHPGKLVLSSTSARMDLDRIEAAMRRLGGGTAAAVARRYWEQPGDETRPDYMRHCLPLYTTTPFGPEVLARTIWKVDVMTDFAAGEARRFDLRPALSRVRCPTLVLGGEDDPICPIDDQAEIAAALPPSLVRFERFPSCRHGVYRDDPERGFRVIREFMAG
ncbi:MAG TPA: alpha/beta hydrolase [Myxococcota bacterium]|nr:alpha/beta hydrolase [Myxococcota bacterium]